MITETTVTRSIDVPSGDAVIEAKMAGAGPAVVMIAGFARGVADLARLSQALAAAGHQAVAVNMRGAEGSSGPFAQLTVDTMVADVEAVTQALGLKRFHVLGHAMGGRLARYFATRRPDMIKTVIVLASGGRPRVRVGIQQFTDAVRQALAGEISADAMDRAMLACGLVAPGNSPRAYRTGWWPNARALSEAWSQKTIDDYLTAGGRPMLVLYGAEDGIVPVANVLPLREELGDQVRLVEIAGAGHCMQEEQPHAVEAALIDWLRDHHDV